MRLQQALAQILGHKRQEGQVTSPFNLAGQQALVLGARAGLASWADFAFLGEEAA